MRTFAATTLVLLFGSALVASNGCGGSGGTAARIDGAPDSAFPSDAAIAGAGGSAASGGALGSDGAGGIGTDGKGSGGAPGGAGGSDAAAAGGSTTGGNGAGGIAISGTGGLGAGGTATGSGGAGGIGLGGTGGIGSGGNVTSSGGGGTGPRGTGGRNAGGTGGTVISGGGGSGVGGTGGRADAAVGGTGGVRLDGGGAGGIGGTGDAGGSTASNCPQTPPANGSDCSHFGETYCYYEDCAGSGRTKAYCSGTTWQVSTGACGSFQCTSWSGQVVITCAGGEICLGMCSEDPICTTQTCGTDPLTPACVSGATGICQIFGSVSGGIGLLCQPRAGTGC